MKEQDTNKKIQEDVWTKQQKNKYLQFVTFHLVSKFDKYPRHFYLKMANVFSNSKTSQQCSNFHHRQKNGCQTLEQLVTKVAQQINQDPSLFIKSPDKIEYIKQHKKSYFKCLQNTKSIEQAVLQEFMKHFNPYQIIISSNQVPKSQQKTQIEGHPQIIIKCNQLFLRPLKDKLYPFIQQIECEEQQNEKIKNKKKLERNKITFKSSQKQKGQNEARLKKRNINWTVHEILKYIVFIIRYKKMITSKKSGVYAKMAEFLTSRDLKQCKSFHNEMMSNFSHLNDLIDDLKCSYDFSQDQMQDQINKIENFYQNQLKKQMNGLNPIKYSLNSFGDNNLNLIKTIVKDQMKQTKLEIRIDENSFNEELNIIETQNQQIQIQLPIAVCVSLLKTSKKKIEKIPISSMPDENSDQFKSQNTKNNKLTLLEKQQILRKSQSYNYQESCLLKNSKSGLKCQKWPILENIKWAAFLMVNRQFFQSTDNGRPGLTVKLSQFLHTDKTVHRCSNHINKWKLNNFLDPQMGIDNQASKYGITKQMIDERKRICMQVRTFSAKIGHAKFEVDSLPTKIVIQKKYFSEEQVARKIYEGNPSLSFYLTWQEKKISEKKQHSGQEQFLEQEKGQNLDGFNSSQISTSVKLEVSSQIFEKLKNNLKRISNTKNTQRSSFFDDEISVKVNLKQNYRLIL